MQVVERWIPMVRSIVVQPGRRRARLRPGVDPHLAILLRITAAFHFRVHEPRVGAAGRALLRVGLVYWPLAWRQKFVEDEEVVARVPLRRILAQLALGDKRVGTVHD